MPSKETIRKRPLPFPPHRLIELKIVTLPSEDVLSVLIVACDSGGHAVWARGVETTAGWTSHIRFQVAAEDEDRFRRALVGYLEYDPFTPLDPKEFH